MFVAIRRSLLQEETDVACAITGELNGCDLFKVGFDNCMMIVYNMQ